jgi:hypothetical protein
MAREWHLGGSEPPTRGSGNPCCQINGPRDSVIIVQLPLRTGWVGSADGSVGHDPVAVALAVSVEVLGG